MFLPDMVPEPGGGLEGRLAHWTPEGALTGVLDHVANQGVLVAELQMAHLASKVLLHLVNLQLNGDNAFIKTMSVSDAMLLLYVLTMSPSALTQPWFCSSQFCCSMNSLDTAWN